MMQSWGGAIPGGARDAEAECRPRSFVGHRPQLSLVTFDDRTADREPDTQAMRLGRVERLEELVDAAGIQADAGVLNEQFDAFAAIDLRLNSERSRTVLDCGHCISCIQQQVQNYLLQLHTIAVYGRQRFREVFLHDRT